MYSIDFTHFYDTYALPKQVVTLMSTTCSEIEIKVFLQLLQCGENGMNASKLAEQLPYSVVKIEEALQFWTAKSFVKAQNAPVPENVVPNTPQKATVKNDLVMSREEATEVLGYDPAAQYLLQAAEMIKGEPISPSEATGYVSIYKLQGMPVEELLLLLKYSQKVSKFNLKYIKKTASEWLNNGIDTMEKADAHISAIERQKELGGKFKAACKIADRDLTKMENEYLFKWVNQFGFEMDMIVLAYEIGVEYTGRLNFKYMNSVLTTWHSKGIKTPNEAKAQPALQKAPAKTTKRQNNKGRTGMDNQSFTAPDTTSRFGRRVLKIDGKE